MKVITARNVNDAYASGLKLLLDQGIREDSRNGPVLAAPWPVATVYLRSTERVLFSPMRDANPFFHFFESLWMLSGRNDVAFPTYFNKNFAQYSDDGIVVHGAYGHRWRKWFNGDQLHWIVQELRKNPESRRCMLTMWDACNHRHSELEPDELKQHISDPVMATAGGRDVPCNTHAYVDARGGRLNLTVCCRSNDIVWGCYGANAVHFSVLQEVLAAAVGVQVGTYTQFSNNFHIYTALFPSSTFKEMIDDAHVGATLYCDGSVEPLSMVQNFERWGDELMIFMENPLRDPLTYRERFFRFVAAPMYAAWRMRKEKQGDSMVSAMNIHAMDWRKACVDWLQRREQRKAQKSETRPQPEVTNDKRP